MSILSASRIYSPDQMLPASARTWTDPMKADGRLSMVPRLGPHLDGPVFDTDPAINEAPPRPAPGRTSPG